ncbi:MAG: Eco57I restriction-modification methylase domain-containing protein [Haliscomenobacter sp.]|nr:Eco57I restriction-modification methylase domain-containing protein [Haliscomenobacter sp.]
MNSRSARRGRDDFVGFDVVVGNPPYIRQEAVTPFKRLFPARVQHLCRHCRPLCVFRGARHAGTAAGGQFSYILPNKWMRAGYGGKLRQFVKRHRIEGISDFGDLPVFEEAITYPCILELSRREAASAFPAAHIGTLAFDGSLGDYIRDEAFTCRWRLAGRRLDTHRSAGASPADKLRAAGKPLVNTWKGKFITVTQDRPQRSLSSMPHTRARLIAEIPQRGGDQAVFGEAGY